MKSNWSPEVEHELMNARDFQDYGDSSNVYLVAALKLYDIGITSIETRPDQRIAVTVEWEDMTTTFDAYSMSDILDSMRNYAENVNTESLAEQIGVTENDAIAFKNVLANASDHRNLDLVIKDIRSTTNFTVGTPEVTAMIAMSYLDGYDINGKMDDKVECCYQAMIGVFLKSFDAYSKELAEELAEKSDWSPEYEQQLYEQQLHERPKGFLFVDRRDDVEEHIGYMIEDEELPEEAATNTEYIQAVLDMYIYRLEGNEYATNPMDVTDCLALAFDDVNYEDYEAKSESKNKEHDELDR